MGDVKKISMTLSSGSSGVLSNGSNQVRFLILPPLSTSATIVATSGASTGYQHPSVGKFDYNLNFTTQGQWHWRFESTGTIVTSTGGTFAVRPKIAST